MSSRPILHKVPVLRLSVALWLLLSPLIATAGNVRAGDPWPAATLTTLEGAPLRLDAGSGGAVTCVDFWATWCAKCREILPRLSALAERLGGNGLRVIAVNVGDERERARDFLAERIPHSSLIVAHDPKGELLAHLGADGMPALYVIDRTGTVRVVESGYDPARLDAVEQTIRTLLESPPAVRP